MHGKNMFQGGEASGAKEKDDELEHDVDHRRHGQIELRSMMIREGSLHVQTNSTGRQVITLLLLRSLRRTHSKGLLGRMSAKSAK